MQQVVQAVRGSGGTSSRGFFCHLEAVRLRDRGPDGRSWGLSQGVLEGQVQQARLSRWPRKEGQGLGGRLLRERRDGSSPELETQEEGGCEDRTRLWGLSDTRAVSAWLHVEVGGW